MVSTNAAMPLWILSLLLPLLHVVDSRGSATQMAVGFNTTFPPFAPTIAPPPVSVPSPVTTKPPPSGSFAPLTPPQVPFPTPVTTKPPPSGSSAPLTPPPVPFPTPVIVVPPPATTPPATQPPPALIPPPVTQPPPASTPPPAPVSKPPPVSSPVTSPPPASKPPPASIPPPVKKPPPVTSPSIDCDGACKARCTLSSRSNLCMRACGTCCVRCKCVPSGTAGHYEECPCYANQKTRNNKPKCP